MCFGVSNPQIKTQCSGTMLFFFLFLSICQSIVCQWNHWDEGKRITRNQVGEKEKMVFKRKKKKPLITESSSLYPCSVVKALMAHAYKVVERQAVFLWNWVSLLINQIRKLTRPLILNDIARAIMSLMKRLLTRVETVKHLRTKNKQIRPSDVPLVVNIV